MWDRDRRARLVDTQDPDYFTLRDFHQALAVFREEHKDHPESLKILDKLDSWVFESGISGL